MSSTRVTVGGLFGIGPDGLSSDQLPDSRAAPRPTRRLQEQMQDKAGAAWKMVQGKLRSAPAQLLDIDVVELLVDGWNKARELRKYRDEAAYPPDEVVVVALSSTSSSRSHRRTWSWWWRTGRSAGCTSRSIWRWRSTARS